MAGKQTSLEMFSKRKVSGTQKELERDEKRQKVEAETDVEETEEMVDQMIMDLATDNRTQKQIEREAKRAQKEAEKAAKQAQREAEKVQREAEKAQREAEKAAKQALKEAERTARQAQREAEKAAKKAKIDARERERELARLAEEEKLRKRSITNFFKVKTDDDVTTNTEEISTPPQTDFNNYFLPFHIGPHVTMHTKTQNVSTKWENLNNQSYTSNTTITIPTPSTSINRASEVLQCLNIGSINEANDKFQNVPLKYLKFYENKKPAYFGTFSYTYNDVIDSKDILTHPCEKIRLSNDSPIIDYDYYSDIDEDDEDGDGEDIDSNDEDSDESDDDENASSDIEAFLDENDSNKSTTAAAAKVIGPLVAVIRHYQQTDNDDFSTYFRSLNWELTPDAPTTPIDPFHNYWGERPDTTRCKIPTPTPTATPKTLPTTSSPITMTVKRRTIPPGPTRTALRTFIMENAHLSLPTLCEVAVKGGAGGRFKDWSKAIVKNTVREEAVWSKKNGWVLIETEKSVDTTNTGNMSITDILSTNTLVDITPNIQSNFDYSK
ncbi:hypothetical protein CANINC_004488 [Pichia inconspicua]|uniref:Uncharacterized protein n=1 Tax=Pichia inconspicua TaxID=52247 RepID=A0A4T0WVF3_9ASCO|nr:hypothetical protein CANINC_004488 [[Candida] inconspicua]